MVTRASVSPVLESLFPETFSGREGDEKTGQQKELGKKKNKKAR